MLAYHRYINLSKMTVYSIKWTFHHQYRSFLLGYFHLNVNVNVNLLSKQITRGILDGRAVKGVDPQTAWLRVRVRRSVLLGVRPNRLTWKSR